MMRGSRLRQLQLAMTNGSVRLWKNEPARWLFNKGILTTNEKQSYGTVTASGRRDYFAAIGEHSTHGTLSHVLDHHLRQSLSKENKAARKATRAAKEERWRLQGGWKPIQASQVSAFWAHIPRSMYPECLDVDLMRIMFS